MTQQQLLFVLATLLFGCSRNEGLPFYRSAEMTPEWLSARESSARSMRRVVPFTMLDQSGRAVTERAFEGKVTIVSFFFTTCGDVCPTTTLHLRELLGGVPDEPRIQVLSYSVAPERDSVAELRQFAEHHQISDPRWHLLTGTREAMEHLARESYFVRLGDGRNYGVASIAHTESVLLVDEHARLRGVYAGMLALEMQRLQEDVALLITEQSGEAKR